MSSDSRIPQDDDEILQAFADLLAEVMPEEPAEIDELLREAGLDPTQIEEEAASLIAEMRRLDWRNRRAEMEQVRKQYDLAGSALPADRPGLLEILRQMTSPPLIASRVHAQFRNRSPEELSDEELRSLIQDIRFITDEGLGNSGEESRQ